MRFFLKQNKYLEDWILYAQWVDGCSATYKNKWKIPPVGIRTFIESPEFLNMKDEVYSEIKNVCAQALHNQYTEAILLAGIGSGKSFTSQVLAVYATYLLLCMTDPFEYYGLAKDKAIAIINMGISATQAKNVVFTGISNMIRNSMFFQEYRPNILKTEIKFEKENIMLLSGNSKETTPLGLNIFFAILDEASFYVDTEHHDVAEEIYNALHSRITSRFGKDGMTIMISSPRYEGDFIMKKVKQARHYDEKFGKNKNHVFYIQMPTWKVKEKYKEDHYRQVGEYFIFDQENNTIIEDIQSVDRSLLDMITDKGHYEDMRYWQIPNDFRKDFEANPEKAKRDFGAIPSLTLEGFFPIPAIIDKMSNAQHINPINQDHTYSFPIPYKVPHFIHIDLALNRNGKGDYAGFSMVHIDKWVKDENTNETYPILYVDLVERIGADYSGEIRFEKIRQKIYDLQNFGFWIELVTFDQFQCLRTGTKIPIVTFDKFQTELYNEKDSINQNPMLTKQSSIPLLKGVDKNIEDLVPGEYVYSINQKGDVGFGKIKSVWSSGKKKIFRVHLDNGKHIDCSDNHPFMLRDGSFKQVKDLRAGESLMPLYRREGMEDLKGYEMVLHPRGKWEYTHRAIARQKKEIERGKVIHHKNVNKRDNSPDNLECLTPSEHHTKHADLGRKNLIIAREALNNNPEAVQRKNAALAATSKRRWEQSPEKMKDNLHKGNTRRWSQQSAHTNMSKIISERNKVLPARLHSKTSQKALDNIKVASQKKWKDPQYIEKMKQRPIYHGEKAPRFDKSLTIEILKQHTDKSMGIVCKFLNTTPGKIRTRIQSLGFTTWKEFCSTTNHKIVAIEDLGIEDEVWDIEVEGTHNFATSAGVFVHNSTDSIQLLRSRGIKADHMSVDRTLEPYNALKQLIYMKRLDVYKYQFLEDELKRLELVKGIKVDHPLGGHKDISDSLAGACYSCLLHTKQSGVLSSVVNS